MKVKIFEGNKSQAINEPFNVIDIIRQRASCDVSGGEAIYICNVSDIIDKLQTWRQYLPRVLPFYGER